MHVDDVAKHVALDRRDREKPRLRRERRAERGS
jgi:hypothetical protein